ncbi:hypothetical protein [Thermoflavimicrobium dichotomicum]|nr:hypothetical protein [Thermoflavimicrobium dichotomicum]
MGSLWSNCDGTEVVTEEGTHPEAREKRISIASESGRLSEVVDKPGFPFLVERLFLK